LEQLSYEVPCFRRKAATCLRRIRDELLTMNAHDRKSFCKVDFERAVNYLKRQKFMTPSDLSSEISSITIDFFNQVRI
jgi:hypothetical protein